MVVSNVTASDFENGPLADLGRTISRIPITKTLDNTSGRETLTEGTPVNILAIAMSVDVTWTQDEVLKLEGADAYIMVAQDTTLNEQDFVTFDGKTYEVRSLITIQPDSTNLFKYGLLDLKS
jgi:hypothetical protein